MIIYRIRWSGSHLRVEEENTEMVCRSWSEIQDLSGVDDIVDVKPPGQPSFHHFMQYYKMEAIVWSSLFRMKNSYSFMHSLWTIKNLRSHCLRLFRFLQFFHSDWKLIRQIIFSVESDEIEMKRLSTLMDLIRNREKFDLSRETEIVPF
jgi:hypothetical protein